MSCLYFVRDCGTLCTFSLVQGRVSTRGELATCLSNVLLGLKYLCRSYVQTDRIWCGSWHTQALLVLWMQRVWCVLSSGQVEHEYFSYSGSITACKITIGKSLQVMHGEINPLCQLPVFKVRSDTVQLWNPGSGSSENSYTVTKSWRRKKIKILGGRKEGCRTWLYRRITIL